jgi:hypothetical protein
MNKETAEFLVKVSEECGNQEATLREDYSGRGMYGSQTCAVTVDSQMTLIQDLIQFMSTNVYDTDDDTDNSKPNEGWSGGPVPDCDGLRIDSMGRGVVIY